MKDFLKMGDFFAYFFRVFRKPDPAQHSNFNLRTMHTINKISIVMFLLGCIFFVTKLMTR